MQAARRSVAGLGCAAVIVATGCRTIPGQDVRYEPTPMPVVRAMLAGVGPQDVVYDLGSGDGRIVLTQDRVEFRQGDMYAADLSAATVGR